MKRILAGLALSMLSLSACSIGSLHPTLYNNKVVDLVNPTTLAIESSAVTYNTVVPAEVTELTLVETEQLRLDYESAMDLLDAAQTSLEFESENLEQEATVRMHLETYLLAAEEYLTAYERVLTYFETEEHSTDPNELDTLDPNLHNAYNTFTEANNDLVTSLAEFVEAEENVE